MPRRSESQSRVMARLQARTSLRRGEDRHNNIPRRRQLALAKVYVSPEGDYIESHQAKPSLLRRVGGKRGVVSGFSHASRRRLWSTIMRLDRSRLPFFVTLTFHRVWPTSFQDLKRMLDTLFKRVRRRYPHASAVWKLEYQRRGAPHFHLLVWGFPFGDRDWLARAWAHVVAYYTRDDVDMLLLWHLGRLGNAHCVQKVRSWCGVTSYAAKYLSKTFRFVTDEGEIIHTGRIWGTFNRNFIPWSYLIYYVTGAAFRRYRRVVRALAQRRGLFLLSLSRDAGFTVYGFGASLPALVQWSKFFVDFRLDNSFLSCYDDVVS